MKKVRLLFEREKEKQMLRRWVEKLMAFSIWRDSNSGISVSSHSAVLHLDQDFPSIARY